MAREFPFGNSIWTLLQLECLCREEEGGRERVGGGRNKYLPLIAEMACTKLNIQAYLKVYTLAFVRNYKEWIDRTAGPTCLISVNRQNSNQCKCSQ